MNIILTLAKIQNYLNVNVRERIIKIWFSIIIIGK